MKSNIGRKILYLIALFFVLLVYIILSPLLGEPFYHIPLLLIPVALALLITFLFMLIVDLIKKTHYSWTYLFLSIIISASLYAGIKTISMQAEQSKQSASPIITSLNNYYKDYNRFPDDMEELKPRYILAIPKSEMGFIGKSYKYSTQENNKDFWLSFNELNNDTWIYINSRNIWVFDD